MRRRRVTKAVKQLLFELQNYSVKRVASARRIWRTLILRVEQIKLKWIYIHTQGEIRITDVQSRGVLGINATRSSFDLLLRAKINRRLVSWNKKIECRIFSFGPQREPKNKRPMKKTKNTMFKNVKREKLLHTLCGYIGWII